MWLIIGPHHPASATTKWVGSSGAQPSSQEPTQDCGLGLNRFSTYILELQAATLEAPLIPSSWYWFRSLKKRTLKPKQTFPVSERACRSFSKVLRVSYPGHIRAAPKILSCLCLLLAGLRNSLTTRLHVRAPAKPVYFAEVLCSRR